MKTTNGASITQTPLAQLSAQLGAVREYLTDMFPERDRAIDNILTAAVAGEHVLMVGIPGTGKSMLAREFARCIDATFYEYLFSKFTTPEEFLGPFSIKGLKDDRYERVLTGRLAECEVAFLDEIFKSNSASLNTLLPVLNERIVFQGGGAQPIPLRIAVAASNEFPKDPSLRALWDRITLRSIVEPLHSDEARRRVMSGVFSQKTPPKLDMSLIDSVDLRAEVVVPDDTVDLVMTMRRELESQKIVYGDRRWVKAMQCVRAYSVTTGQAVVGSVALRILTSVLWDKPDQIGDIESMVNKVAAPYVVKARAIYDALQKDITGDVGSMVTESLTTLIPKMATAHTKIAKQAKKAPAGPERDEVRQIAHQLRSEFERARATLKERYGLNDEVEEVV